MSEDHRAGHLGRVCAKASRGAGALGGVGSADGEQGLSSFSGVETLIPEGGLCETEDGVQY